MLLLLDNLYDDPPAGKYNDCDPNYDAYNDESITDLSWADTTDDGYN